MWGEDDVTHPALLDDDAPGRPPVLVRCPFCRFEQHAPRAGSFRCAACGNLINPSPPTRRPPADVDWPGQPMLALQPLDEDPEPPTPVRRRRQFED